MNSVTNRDLLMAQRVIQDLPRLMQARRTQLGMSMREVAHEVELAPATVCRFASGRDVSLETAVRIIKWLAWADR